MRNWIFGINIYKKVEKTTLNVITTIPPIKPPKQKINPFLKPVFFALFIAIILFGPGVKDTITIYERNEIH